MELNEVDSALLLVMAIGAVILVLFYVWADVLVHPALAGIANATATFNTTRNVVSIALADPPQVPAGTTSLILQYSGVSVHQTGGGWINSSVSGTADLILLVNSSQVLANINVTSGSRLDMARFNIVSMQTVINGQRYNVTVPNGIISTGLGSNVTVNGTTEVLVDMSPAVVSTYNNTSQVLVFAPSVGAVVFAGRPAALTTVAGNSTKTPTTRPQASPHPPERQSRRHRRQGRYPISTAPRWRRSRRPGRT